MTQRRTTPSAKQCIQQVIGLLSQVPPLSNEGFQNISNHMGNFSSSFATGASRAIAIRERIESDGELGLTPLQNDLRKVYREITGAFREMEALANKKSAYIEQMRDIGEWARNLEQEAFLPPIVDQIRGRIGQGLEVQTLGAIIDSMIQQIKPLIQDVIGSSNEAEDIIHHLTRRISADLASSRHNLTGLKKDASALQRSLGKSVRKFDAACATMTERSSAVSSVVFEMVQSMQFDDITAQRIGHIITALESALEMVQKKSRSQKDKRWLALAIKIIMDQLQATTGDLMRAIEDTESQLTQIAYHAVDQTKSVSHVRAVGSAFRHDIDDIAYCLNSMLRLNIFDETLSTDLLAGLSAAENASMQAKRALTVLEITSARLEKLASSLSTQESERLSILTGSIISLAQTIQREAPEQIRNLNAATTKLHAISLAFSDKSTPRLVRTNSLLRRIPLSTKQLDGNNNDIICEMNETLADAQADAIQISLLSAELSFNRTISKLVEEALNALEALLRREKIDLEEVLKGDDILELAKEFDDLQKLYTMESERRLHQASIAGDEAADGGEEDSMDIELF